MSDDRPVSVVPFGRRTRPGIIKGGCGDASCSDCYERFGEFSDAESERVFDAIRDALVPVLAQQAAREWYDEWVKKLDAAVEEALTKRKGGPKPPSPAARETP
jgi:hypothetical protein